MASMQVQKGAGQDFNTKQVQFGTRATIYNKTLSSSMTLDRCINWFGNPSTGSFPNTILPNSNSKFVHIRDGQFGSMAAVQYSRPGNGGKTCAWILAWNAPSDDTAPLPPNRVYVTCGTKARMDSIDWDQVLLNLEEASTTSTAQDSYSMTRVDAIIDDSIPRTATLNANFEFMD